MYTTRKKLTIIDLTHDEGASKVVSHIKNGTADSPIIIEEQENGTVSVAPKLVKAKKRAAANASESAVVKRRKKVDSSATTSSKTSKQIEAVAETFVKPIQRRTNKVKRNNELLVANCSSISDSEDEVEIVENRELRDCVNDDDDRSHMLPLEDCNEFPLWDVSSVLSEEMGISQVVANNIVKLIDDDNTMPFIARYRKSMVDFMSPERLQEMFDSYQRICKMKRKSLSVLQTLKKNNKLTEEVQNSILSARSIAEIDLVYEPLKVSNTISSRMKKFGLEASIKSILAGENVSFQSLCNSELKTPDDVKTHLILGLANAIYKDPSVLEYIRQLKSKNNIMIECQKARTRKTEDDTKPMKNKFNKNDDKTKYDFYDGFSMSASSIKPHQILAINRGEAMKALSVKVVVPTSFLGQFIRFCKNKWNVPIIINVVKEAYKRYIHPWISRNVRSDMTSRAVKESVNVFCLNLKRLLLTKPIKGHNILGIDPGFKAGCKIAIIGTTGAPLETLVLYPRFNIKYDNEGKKLLDLIYQYKCETIALGNGTASRETEKWLQNLDIPQNKIVIVPEQGASIYSCSPEAAKEFPGMDPNLISAISIARRVLDPLSELVKVNAKHMGVGMYQHDVQEKILSEALDNIVVHCVSFVGIDLNTASHTLLVKVAGLTAKKVKSIIEYRDKSNGFKSRDELLKVPGIGPKTFTQCAGFLRVPNSSVKLDNTWIHPESYDLAYRFIESLKLDSNEIGTVNFVKNLQSISTKINFSEISAKLNCTKSDIDLIIEALTQLASEEIMRNIKPIYSMAANSVEDLVEGATLTGVVSNVTPFGVFVECGVGRNGLIHNSKFGDSEPPQLGDKVLVTVISPLTENRLPLKLIRIIN